MFKITINFGIRFTEFGKCGNCTKVLSVDDARTPYDHTKLGITVMSYKDDKADKTTHYTVYTKDSDNLVMIDSGPSKGNRVLLIEKGMYLATKGSSRPVRITPMQRLMGQASFGDLATSNG